METKQITDKATEKNPTTDISFNDSYSYTDINTSCTLWANLLLCTSVPWDLWAIMCFTPRRRWNIIVLYSTLDSLPLHILQAKWAMFSTAGRAEGPTAARNPSSAGMQYHLSKYLDNWIWEGSRSHHCNQWHCQQCHWEPASSCTTQSQTERGEN